MTAAARSGAKHWTTRAVDLLLAALATLVSFAVYAISPVHQSTDSRWTLHVAQSVILEGNLDLDEYYAQGLMSPDDYRIVHVGDHVYSYFPIGTPLLAVIPLALYRSAHRAFDVGPGELSPRFEMMLASGFVSLCAGLIYAIGRLYLDRPGSLLLAVVLAFCTSAWSTASRALWQHGPSMLMLSLTLYLVLLADRKESWIQFASLPLACSLVIRPTNGISVVCLSAYVLIRHRKYALNYLVLGSVVASPFIVLNWTTWHSFLPPYYLPGRIGANPEFGQALAANLVSPARGLFVYSPVLLASLGGVFLRLRGGQLSKLDATLALIVVLHLVAVSSFPHWWGGHAFGPRFMTDVVPYLMYFAIPVIAATFKLYGIARFSYAVPVGLLAAVSFWFHYRGATSVATYVWNRRPVNVDRAPSRLWDWWDAPYLRGTSRLDALLSPSISVRPAQATVMRQPGDLDTRRVSLELHETRYKRFRWHASVPPGVAVVPAQGEGASRYELAACVPWGDYPPGKHALGKIELLVRWDGRQKGREVLISVPIEVYVLESRHSVYLPLVSLSGGGD